jgi:hypothetical protein
MGLAYPETLPRRARRELDNTDRSAHLLLPIRTELKEQITYTSGLSDEASPLITFLRRLPGLSHLGQTRKKEWIAFSKNSVVCNEGRCTIEMGFVLADVLNNYERVSDHCSNIAVAVIEAESDRFDSHQYLDSIKSGENRQFQQSYKQFAEKYAF